MAVAMGMTKGRRDTRKSLNRAAHSKRYGVRMVIGGMGGLSIMIGGKGPRDIRRGRIRHGRPSALLLPQGWHRGNTVTGRLRVITGGTFRPPHKLRRGRREETREQFFLHLWNGHSGIGTFKPAIVPSDCLLRTFFYLWWRGFNMAPALTGAYWAESIESSQRSRKNLPRWRITFYSF